MTRNLTVLGFGIASLMAAAGSEPPQTVRMSQTQRAEFPPGGTLRLAGSNGMVTVEAWDRPDVEVTTIEASRVPLSAGEREKIKHEMKDVHVAVERRGDELAIAAHSPWRANFDLEYRIKAPAAAKLIVTHHDGEVYVDGLTGDINVTARQGDILLHLPQEALYDINATSTWGSVNSDYTGDEKRRWWLVGHRVENVRSPATHKLNLKIGYGDIMIMKRQVPKPPGVAVPIS